MALSRPRVLVLRALGLGDLCTGVPALRAIARAFEEHEIVLAAPAWQAPIVRACGIDRILDVTDTGTIPWTDPPDIAINLHGRGPESTRRLLRLSPVRLIAYRHADVPETAAQPSWRREDHEVERWCRLLIHHDISCDAHELRLTRPAPVAEDHAGAVVVHPGAASTGRRWPAARFAAVVRALDTHGFDVVLTGSAAEVDLCSTVRDLAGTPRITSLAGSTDLERLCALIGSARAVVSNDTGVAHLATAFAVPSVTIFGPTSPEQWGPPATSIHRCLWAGSEGDPHAAELDPGLAAITVDEVTATVYDVLRTTEARRPEVA